MSTKLNKVGHCKQGNSDKVYIACIVPSTDANGLPVYNVVGKASRIYKRMKIYHKGSFSSLMDAAQARDEIFFSKVKKGYVDIETSSYNGQLDHDDKWLLENVEPDPLFNSAFDQNEDEVTPELEEESQIPSHNGFDDEDDFEVLCINAVGMEDSFDFEITYIAEKHAEDDMIYVWDRNGEKKECFLERFALCEAAE